ncbi:hypothetical protein [Spirosoma sp. KCTC 42546]|uniref:hypothetical protein n=1 Tax=Spirosoma sp. KCTC 42546 TaxID=2520506 RepID=UPI001AEF3B05|nr:hypothetical protein [Spirosoma sp. KCTC 42546]
MKLTWTFYPKGEQSITLTVIYLPKLDTIQQAGVLDQDTNVAFVNWRSFQVFNTGDVKDKRALFNSLTTLDSLAREQGWSETAVKGWLSEPG